LKTPSTGCLQPTPAPRFAPFFTPLAALLASSVLLACTHIPEQGAAERRTPVAVAPAPPPSPVSPISPRPEMHASPALKMLAPGAQAYIPPQPANTAKYQEFADNPWKRVAEEPLSTFSADVDTGSYANVRRFINRGQLPPRDAVRAEEMVNYFGYDYAGPKAGDAQPFSIHAQLAAAPWKHEHGLLRIAIKGKDLAKESLPAANLVFLVDVSGSMSPTDRLPLVKSALKLLVAQMRAVDRVSLVTYASGTNVVLPATAGNEKEKINNAIEMLVASGSTAGEAGIRLAYAQAREAHIKGGINRVLLATDGDLNVGVTDPKQLKILVETERQSGTGFSTLGVGDSNYNEALMKQLADIGDGSYHYLDTLQEAHKVLVNEFTSTLAVIAQDVKLQVEFNPANVNEYRLIGYELRALTREQFNDDKVDAGDVGAGHAVTALYEVIPKGVTGKVDALRYQKKGKPAATPAANADELAWIKVRYKDPGSSTSKLIAFAVKQPASLPVLDKVDSDFRFATAVAGWSQWLRCSTLIGNFNASDALAIAREARGNDRYGHRAEFLRLVELSATLKRQ